jgi:hypothetical protein
MKNCLGMSYFERTEKFGLVEPKVISELINGKYASEAPENSPVFDPENFENIGEVSLV